MRTHKKHGILLAGINGHKIYYKDEQYLIVFKYKVLQVKKEDEQIVSNYINLKYQNKSDHEKIINDFLELTKGFI